MKNRKPYLFYFEKGVNAWIPAPKDLDSVMPLDNLEPNEYREIRFKRVDLTDKEYSELAEA